MGFQATLKGIVAEVVGGVGNVPGAIVGSLLLGLIESYGIALFGTSYRNLFAFVLLIVDAGAAAQRPVRQHAAQLPPEPLTGTFIAPSRPVRAAALGCWRRCGRGGSRCRCWSTNGLLLQTLTNAWLYALLALSLTLVAGTVGQVSLGHAGAAGDRRLCLGAAGARISAVPVGLAILAGRAAHGGARHRCWSSRRSGCAATTSRSPRSASARSSRWSS